MNLAYSTYDVFTDTRFAGNPLAVVYDADALSDAQMQTIAREFNLSETIFVRTPENAQHEASVRIFTPTKELPFAGHPTIGCAIALAERRHAQGYLGHLQAQFEAEGLKVETCVCRGAPGERVRQQCEQLGANLVVMATHGRSGVSRALMGSVALDVLHHGHLPMLLVHPSTVTPKPTEAEAVGLKPA